MQQILNVIQIVTSVLIIGAILLQQQGTGLSQTFGGEGNVYRTKRGLEKFLVILTIILAVIFLGTAFVSMLII